MHKHVRIAMRQMVGILIWIIYDMFWIKASSWPTRPSTYTPISFENIIYHSVVVRLHLLIYCVLYTYLCKWLDISIKWLIVLYFITMLFSPSLLIQIRNNVFNLFVALRAHTHVPIDRSCCCLSVSLFTLQKEKIIKGNWNWCLQIANEPIRIGFVE